MQNRTRAGGLAVAVALHAAAALLLYLYRVPHTAQPVAESWIQLVRVAPPRPRPAPPAAPAASPKPKRLPARAEPARETTIVAIPPAPAEAAPAAPDRPGIDMDAARRVAAEVAREENQRAQTHPNMLKTKRLTRQERLARAIENAHKPDCKNAYAGMGLLAIIPLAKDALASDPSCRW